MNIELDITGRPHLNGLYWGGKEESGEAELTDMLVRGEISKKLLEDLIAAQNVYRTKLELIRGQNKEYNDKLTPTKPNI
jgi:hypothetical protein